MAGANFLFIEEYMSDRQWLVVNNVMVLLSSCTLGVLSLLTLLHLHESVADVASTKEDEVSIIKVRGEAR